jgi:aspartyl-tRNA(Asn)/glutamyl-tRNA(Gln) amidotransferase subunit C
MSVNRDDVAKIARLSKLHLDEEELDAFALQFQRILEYVEKLEEVDVSGIPPTSQVSLGKGGSGSHRADEVRESLDEAEALAGAPDAGSGHFKVPRMI